MLLTAGRFLRWQQTIGIGAEFLRTATALAADRSWLRAHQDTAQHGVVLLHGLQPVRTALTSPEVGLHVLLGRAIEFVLEVQTEHFCVQAFHHLRLSLLLPSPWRRIASWQLAGLTAL